MNEDLEKIHDKPIKDCMLKAAFFLKQGENGKASQKMFEALAAFKFQMFGYFSDFRIQDLKFVKKGFKIDMPNLIGDLAFKLIFKNDSEAIKLLMSIGSHFDIEDTQVKSVSNYSYPTNPNDETARNQYNEILRIILGYQDYVPHFVWRIS